VKTRLLITSIALLAILSPTVIAQKARTVTPAPKPAPGLLASLPKSDAVAIVNVRQLLNEVMPRMLAENPGKLAEANAELDKFKTRTGIDPRSFDQLALGLTYVYPTQGVTKVESVVLARGAFNAAGFVAAGRIASNGKYREEKYQGHTIYVFTLEQQMRVMGLFNLRVNDLAVTALSSNVLALGTPVTVKWAIDAGQGRRGVNQELIELATRDPNAAIGFGGNITPELVQSINLGNEETMKDLSNIRQAYGSVGVTEKDVEMLLAARTLTPTAAKNLSGTLDGLKTLAGFLVGGMPAPKGPVARTALNNMKITTQGNELQVRTSVAQVDVASLLRGK
jgi:hypothetical protein